MTCCGSSCRATADHFDARVAEGDRQRYKRKGLDKRAGRLVEALTEFGVGGSSVLDVGSGIGMISLELLKRGAASATLADVSPAYLQVARAEAVELRLVDQMEFIEGDFVETSGQISQSDVVVMDRAICCYPAWRPLMTAAAERCRRALVMTYPRNRPDIKLALGLENLQRRFKKDTFRAFVHPPREMDAALCEMGLRRVHRAGTWVWHIDLYARDGF